MKRLAFLLVFLIFLVQFSIAESVTRMPYTVVFSDSVREGLYTGDIQNGIPDGFGVFEAVNDEGEAWHYIGDWSKGQLSGEGRMVWDSGQIKIGKFAANEFVSGKILDEPQKSVHVTAYFMTLFEAIYSGETPEIKKDEFASADFKKLLRNPDDYMYAFTQVDGTILQIIGEDPNSCDLRIQAADGSGVYYVGMTEYVHLDYNLLVGDHVTAYGLYVGPYTYNNTDGYTTTLPAIACIALDLVE